MEDTLVVLAAMLRNPSRLGKISIVVPVHVLDHRVRAAMRKLVCKVAAQIGPSRWVRRGLAFDRTLKGIAILTSRHKSSSMAVVRS